MNDRGEEGRRKNERTKEGRKKEEGMDGKSKSVNQYYDVACCHYTRVSMNLLIPLVRIVSSYACIAPTMSVSPVSCHASLNLGTDPTTSLKWTKVMWGPRRAMALGMFSPADA